MILNEVTTGLVAIIIAYLLGSINSAYIITRLTTGKDIRRLGGGNAGGRNVFREVGLVAAIPVAIFDVGKGTASVAIAHWLLKAPLFDIHPFVLLAGIAAVAGHNWSVFLKFKGGRGVATFFGGLIALCLVAALFGGAVLIIGVGLTRYVSLGSIAGALGTCAILVPLTIISGFPIEYLVYALIGATFIIVMHRDNIARLLSGTERKIGEKIERGDSPPP